MTVSLSLRRDVIGPELPDDEIGPLRKNVAAESGNAAGHSVTDAPLLMISMRAAGRSLASSRRITSG